MLIRKLNLFNFSESKYFIRAMSFKVLNVNLNQAPEIQKAENNSNSVDHKFKILLEFAKSGRDSRSIHRHTVVNKKLLVRDRLKLLLDDDSPFLEIGLLAGMFMDYGTIPSASVVVGIGKIHGRYCIIGANDATVKGGAFFPITVKKSMRMQDLGYLNKLPCIHIVDSAGAFLPLQSEIFPDKDHGGRAFYNEAVMSSLHIPQIAIVCGSSTAGAAYTPTMAEEAIIVKESGVIFLAGPPLVKAATGEIVTEQDLGGALMHCSVSGCTDYLAESEEEAFELCRESILTFNSPHYSKPTSFPEPLFPSNELTTLSGKEDLLKEDMYVILSRILDGSMFKEFKAKFGAHLITGFGYVHGMLVGILANSNNLSVQDAQKGAHFIQLCEKRKIPLCFLQNSGTFINHETQLGSSLHDSLKWRAKMVAAHSCSKVPKITLCVNSCYGDDNFTMCGWSFRPNFFLAWPAAHISSVKEPLKELNSNLSPKSYKDCETLFEDNSSTFYLASHMQCDAIIAPENTREVLALCLEIALSKYYNSVDSI